MSEKEKEKKKCKNCYYIQQGFCLCANSKRTNKFVLLSTACEFYSESEPKQIDAPGQTF